MNNKKANTDGDSFCYRDFARNGARNRNNVVRVDDPEPTVGTTDTYHTYFRYPEEFRKHVKETGSVSGYKGPCHADYIPFDIDDTDLNKSLSKARDFLDGLAYNYDIPPDQLHISFSGSKGFHIQIPAVLVGGIEPSDTLHFVFRRIAEQLGGPIIDMKIYDKTRLWRDVNTINSKSGLYKVPITVEEIRNLTIDEIKELAKAPRRDVEFLDPEELIPIPELVELYQSVLGSLYRDQDAEDKACPADEGAHLVQSFVEFDKPCLNTLASGMAEGLRNDAAIRLTSHLRSKGLPREIVSWWMENYWNPRNTPPMDSHELESTLHSAYSGGYTYSCNDSVLKSNCNEQCPYHEDCVDLDTVAPKVGDFMDDVMDAMRRRQTGEMRPIRTPFEVLNAHLGGGLWPGLYTLVGTPGTGKSQWATQVALHAALNGVPVTYVGLELGQIDIQARLLGLLTGTYWSNFFLGRGHTEIRPSMLDQLRNLPFHFRSAPPYGWTYEDFLKEAKAFIEMYENRSTLIVIDFMQLVTGKSREEMRAVVGKTAYVGRSIAKDHNAVVLLVSSTSREHYSTLSGRKKPGVTYCAPGDGNPTRLLGTGKEAGEIEYAADGTFVLTREQWEDDTRPDEGTRIHLAISKLRWGRPEWVDLNFDGNRFTDSFSERIDLRRPRQQGSRGHQNPQDQEPKDENDESSTDQKEEDPTYNEMLNMSF